MKTKVIVDYPQHDSNSLSTIYMATTRREPTAADWAPCYRDTIDGRTVLWIKTNTPPEGREVWVKDRAGTRKMTATVA